MDGFLQVRIESPGETRGALFSVNMLVSGRLVWEIKGLNWKIKIDG